MILAISGILLSLVLVIGIHEAGHAIAAYAFGVKILKISIGFGRPLIRWRSPSGCQWILSIFPVGGYVQLLNTRIKSVASTDFSMAFDKQPIWVRSIILLSGALANFIVAYLALMLVFMLGYRQVIPVVGMVEKNSMAAQAGIQAGEQIIKIADQHITSWRDVNMAIILSLGQDAIPITLKKQHGITYHTILHLPKQNPWNKKNDLFDFIGLKPNISPSYLIKKPGVSLIKACYLSFMQLQQFSYFFIIMLKQLLMGAIPFRILLGPISMFKMIIQAFLEGLVVFSYIIGNLSLVVGLINLLPIPTLDGGSILYLLIEKVRGRPISVALEVLIHRLIVIVFSILCIQLLLNDVLHLLIY